MASHKNHKDNEDPKSGFAAAAGRAEDSARNAGAADPAASGESGAAGNGSAAEQLQKLLAEKQELMNTLVRRQADFENYRKRVEKERHQDRHRGVEGLIEQLLPVLDAFDRALVGHDDPANADYRKGFEMIRGPALERSREARSGANSIRGQGIRSAFASRDRERRDGGPRRRRGAR